jgi:hypothetical protein
MRPTASLAVAVLVAVSGFERSSTASAFGASGVSRHASRYSTWAGGYSSIRGVLVLASGYPENQGVRGLDGISARP